MAERWRSLAAGIAIPFILGGVSACEGTASQPTSGPSTVASSEHARTVLPDVHNYYPQLETMPLSASGSFVTQAGSRVSWYNFAQNTFNPDAAKA